MANRSPGSTHAGLPGIDVELTFRAIADARPDDFRMRMLGTQVAQLECLQPENLPFDSGGVQIFLDDEHEQPGHSFEARGVHGALSAEVSAHNFSFPERIVTSDLAHIGSIARAINLLRGASSKLYCRREVYTETLAAMLRQYESHETEFAEDPHAAAKADAGETADTILFDTNEYTLPMLAAYANMGREIVGARATVQESKVFIPKTVIIVPVFKQGRLLAGIAHGARLARQIMPSCADNIQVYGAMVYDGSGRIPRATLSFPGKEVTHTLQDREYVAGILPVRRQSLHGITHKLQQSRKSCSDEFSALSFAGAAEYCSRYANARDLGVVVIASEMWK